MHSCYEDEVCFNTIGSYECDLEDTSNDECDPGYRFFLVTCIDINECFEDTNACPDGEICVNTEGNFTCETQEKYKVEVKMVYHVLPTYFFRKTMHVQLDLEKPMENVKI